MNACRPNPCGPNSQCKDLKGMAACSCLPGFHGYPPNCMDMCQDSDDCDFDKACIDKVCADPCEMNICGMNANCSVSNHSPICKCANGFTGNPFNGCQRSIRKYYYIDELDLKCKQNDKGFIDTFGKPNMEIRFFSLLFSFCFKSSDCKV